MAAVRFEVRHSFTAPARVVWDELIDWKGHEAWIPATKVEIHTDGDPTAVGAEFTATTGYGPLAPRSDAGGALRLGRKRRIG